MYLEIAVKSEKTNLRKVGQFDLDILSDLEMPRGAWKRIVYQVKFPVQIHGRRADPSYTVCLDERWNEISSLVNVKP